MRSKVLVSVVVSLLLLVQTWLLVWLACVHSPLVDEPAHLVSGLHHWHTFSFDLYRVNPPLVRGVAAIPLLVFVPQTDWHSYSADQYKRTEFPVGSDFIAANKDFRFYLILARLFCIPLSVLGGLVCYLWGRELFGISAGILALTLWCFSPMVLAFGYTIMPDVAAASLGVSACYLFWKWIKQQNYPRAVIAGTVLGLAELCKFSLIVLYPILVVVWIVSVCTRCGCVYNRLGIVSQLKQLAMAFVVSLFVINMGYGFEGSFVPLKDYAFISRTLCGDTKWNHETGFTTIGNRFRGSFISHTPIPLLYNYISGIDVQKYDFEIGRPSYLKGSWSLQGWYSYYFWGLLYKEPLALWCLIVLAFSTIACSSKYRVDCASEVLLNLPIIAILLLVSSQPKLNHHLRYTIPLLPFLCITTSRIWRSLPYRNLGLLAVSGIVALWLLISAALTFPHYQGYFNELVCVKHFTSENPPPLLGSNIDWGQNSYFLKTWYDRHPLSRPMFIAYSSSESLDRLGIESSPPPKELVTGYYAIGINELFDSSNQYAFFRDLTPVDRIGYSIYVYHVTPEMIETRNSEE